MSGGARNRHDIDALKARVPLTDIFAPFVTWDRKKSNPRKRDYWACCPFHGEKTPSFHVMDQRAFFNCFGCGQKGDHVKALMLLEGLDAKAAIARLNELAGGDARPVTAAERAQNQKIAQARAREAANEARRKWSWARELWDTGTDIRPHGPVMAYLRGRGLGAGTLYLDGIDSLRESRIRYGKDGPVLPAMLGAITDRRGGLIGVHRTFVTDAGVKYVDPDGGKAKKIAGQADGGVIRLYRPAVKTDRLFIAEGIETALSILQALTKRGDWAAHPAAVWVGVSLGNFAKIKLPDAARHVTICADNDSKHPEEARGIVEDAARAMADDGRTVRIAWPHQGQDFNDMMGAAG